MYRAPRFERGGCRRESCPECQFTGMWLNPNSRGSRLRIWQPWGCNSLHAHHFTATGFSGNSRPRRLKIAEPSGCKSRVADRRVVNREQQTGSTQDRTALGVQVSPRRPIWNDNWSSEPGLFAKQCVPSGKRCKSTAFRHSCARSSKRAGGFILRIALDQCRVPERYRTRVPFRPRSSM